MEEVRSIQDDSWKATILEKYHEFLKVFNKVESERMLVKKLWDHEILLKKGFMPRKAKIYPMSPQEKAEVEVFITHQLEKGYIRPSKSPQTSPVFFVPKKDRAKRMVQNYRYLNAWTVCNNYLLSLISNVIDQIQNAKYFTKLDLR